MTETTEKPAAQKKRASWVALLPLLIFVGLAAVFAVQLLSGKDNSIIPSVLIGKQAPLTNLLPVEGLMRDGAPVSGFNSEDLKTGPGGKLTLVNVWGSWCVPCRQEHPLLMEIAKDERIRVVGINYKDQPENARRFLGDLGNPFAAVGADRAGRSAIEWGVYGVPETFLVDQTGKIVYKHVGPFTPESVKNDLLPAVEKALQQR
ncbi:MULTISPECIES: DsbE family thiol:disulfide interchange protein [Brucella]|uniref:Periplasmic protein thiol-disulphide oxidoreductase DsbE n=1 Tax=Brucella ceti M644/93/1 TaxID=520459 RepID=A0ABM9ZC52_9HYPH|nr:MULTISPECIES: DsbE family thiol:disulfide interchange protein [Brucella]AHB00201.1 periplasmic protein thiol:disulfide oxidoreductase, DsbE subfamily protein [Brucella ceti TE10759-12]EEX89758.1 periplasmic protein thiol-disulphide oxidoreductase DsbE [Brucella ceti M13/05/1]EEX97238.1 periplasmic protein thiol-disulphide oxidoreductase DsbE [Brucella ceti M644/93/1]ENR09594.1 periplasmic protein thiol:disulfide oxidoreductase, DsbE subfamily [Brucella sp. UK38/05]ENT12001.1 periplasmic pro